MNKVQMLMDKFEISLKSRGKYYSGPCPFHYGADNPTAFNIYKNEPNKWWCNTHQCHEIFVPNNIFGFAWAIISKYKYGWSQLNDKKAPKKEIFNYLNKNKLFNNNSNRINFYRRHKTRFINNIDKSNIRLNIPSNYFLKRGFSAEILKKYKVGDCFDKNSIFYNRAVVPIMNSNMDILFYSGRSINPRCNICLRYHKGSCPINNVGGVYSKWVHSPNIKTSSTLYNFNFVRHRSYTNVVLVEGPADVWKLEESGINNGLALFGTSLSLEQMSLLFKLNVNEIIICLDNDEPGQQAATKLKYMMDKFFHTSIVIPTNNDLGDMSANTIKELFK